MYSSHLVGGVGMFEIRYENGASHMVHDATTFQEAIEIAESSLKGCMPEGFNLDNLVRVTVVRKLGFCAVCGKDLKGGGRKLNCDVGYSVWVCEEHIA
jgi:hypothetical protein